MRLAFPSAVLAPPQTSRRAASFSPTRLSPEACRRRAILVTPLLPLFFFFFEIGRGRGVGHVVSLSIFFFDVPFPRAVSFLVRVPNGLK